jgi:putative flippase GtrA
MMKKFLKRIYEFRYQFAKYFVIGFSAFILDIGSLFFLKELFHISSILAVILNQLFVVNYVFLLNKNWSFQSTGLAHRQILRFYAIAAMNYAISIAWMWVVNHRFGVYYVYSRVANIIVAVGWNFLLYKFWVYKETTISGDNSQQSS